MDFAGKPARWHCIGGAFGQKEIHGKVSRRANHTALCPGVNALAPQTQVQLFVGFGQGEEIVVVVVVVVVVDDDDDDVTSLACLL